MADKPKTAMLKRGRGHSYLLDGEDCPGVTTILSQGVPKPGLVGWAAGATADFVVNRLNVARNAEGKVRIVADELLADAIAWNATRGYNAAKVGNDELPRLALADILKNIRFRDLDEASGRGTEVHKFAEKLTHGERVVVPPEIAGHVRAYVKFLREWGPTNAITERVVVNRHHRYMGKFDLLADFPGVFPDGPFEGREIGSMRVDIKTSRSGIFPETGLQLAAYEECDTMLDGDDEVPNPKTDYRAAVWVRADGYDVHVFADHDGGAFAAFLDAKRLGEWLNFKNPDSPARTIVSPALTPPMEK